MTTARSLTGDIALMSVADVIVWLANRERTGALTIAQGVVAKTIYIEHGQAIRVDSNSPREDLGQFALNFGLTTPSALESAHHLVAETDIRLGRVLVRGNVAAESAVRNVVEHQIRESILDTVRWDIGQFEFRADVRARPKAEVAAAVPLLALHKLAAARAPHWSAFHLAFPRLDVRLRIDERAVPDEPDPIRDQIIALVRNGATVEAVLQQLLMMEYDLYARLYELVRLGVLTNFDVVAPPPSISPGDISFDMIVEAPVEAPAERRAAAPVRNIPYPPPIVPPAPSVPPRAARLASDLIPPPVPASVFQVQERGPTLPFGGGTPLPTLAAGAIPLSAPASMRMPNWPTPPGGSVVTGAGRAGVMHQSTAAHAPHDRGGVSTATPEPPRVSRTPRPSAPPPPQVTTSVRGQQVPRLVGELESALRLRASPRERYILKRIDGSRTVADILQMVPMSDREMVDLLHGLVAAGLVQLP